MATVLGRFGVPSPVPKHILAETQIGKTVDQIVRAIEALLKQVPGGDAVRLDLASTEATPVIVLPETYVALENARLLMAMRKLRERAFGPDLFSDPAWDMLVELYVAMAEDKTVSVGNACITTGLPLTSALRLCQQLQRRGLLMRDRDPFDRRRVLLRLSVAAYEVLTHVLSGTKVSLAG